MTISPYEILTGSGTLSNSTCSTSCQFMFSATLSSSVTLGTYTITVAGTAGVAPNTATQTGTLSLTVASPPPPVGCCKAHICCI